MRADRLPFGGVERAGLGEDVVGDADLADVVQPAGEAAEQHARRVEPERICDAPTEVGDLLAVRLVGALMEAGGEREALRQPDNLRLFESDILDAAGCEQPGLVSPGALGDIQRAVGDIDQAIRRPGPRGREDAADRHGHGNGRRAVAGEHGPSRDCLPQRLREPLERVLARHVRQQERELLAAPAGDQVLFPHQPRQLRRDAAQDRVADDMAVGVVDALEVVDVDHQQAQRPALRAASAVARRRGSLRNGCDSRSRSPDRCATAARPPPWPRHPPSHRARHRTSRPTPRRSRPSMRTAASRRPSSHTASAPAAQPRARRSQPRSPRARPRGRARARSATTGGQPARAARSRAASAPRGSRI